MLPARTRLFTRSWLAGLVLLVAVVLVVGAAGQASGVAVRSSAAACKSPTAQPPNVGTDSQLSGVAVEGCKVWAVGYHRRHGVYRTLIEQWNRNAWKVQASHRIDELNAVAATSPTNAWAVGNALILHWDGSSWQFQLSPNPGGSAALRAVAATSSANAWAVGDYVPSGTSAGTLIEHWDGSSWQVQSSPSAGGFGVLDAVVATSPITAWAVGTLILHWDGTSWQVQPSPGGSDLSAVAATSPTNAWAVGLDNFHPLILHWDGASWQAQPTPNPGPTHTYNLRGVAATSATNAWAVGYASLGGGRARTVVLHWNGTVWRVDNKAPSPGSSAALYGVAATSPTNVWAVGSYRKGGVNRTLALHWNGTSWKP